MRDDNNFWKFNPADKWDELSEGRIAHLPLISGALRNAHTGIDRVEQDSYIMFDTAGEEALLFRPKTLVMKLGMLVYTGFLKVMHK